MGLPPTGKSVSISGIDSHEYNDAGLISAHWGVMDMFSMMQQLAVIPAGPPA